MASLYPEIKLPTLIAPKTPAPADYQRVAPYFDFDSGEFRFDKKGQIIFADSRETFEQWCLKVCMTERLTRLAYSGKIGAEFEAAMKMPNVAAVKSSIIRTITQTILVHPRARAVKNFKFSGETDYLNVEFTVEAIDFETRLEVTI